MKTTIAIQFTIVTMALAAALGCASTNVSGNNRTSAESERSAEARAALVSLNNRTPAAENVGASAKAVLVFPRVLKGGFMVGGFRGTGTLFKDGKTSGYYKTMGASYGLQAGLQEYGYALFFMSDEALAYVDSTSGWEIGVGPSIVIVDEGAAKTMTSTTLKSDVYAFVFDQRGLMAGLGLQGSKISRID